MSNPSSHEALAKEFADAIEPIVSRWPGGDGAITIDIKMVMGSAHIRKITSRAITYVRGGRVLAAGEESKEEEPKDEICPHCGEHFPFEMYCLNPYCPEYADAAEVGERPE